MASEYEILVAGGGIAGLTAALTAARLGRRTMLLTGPTLGGHLLSLEKVEGFPGFPDGAPGFDLCPAVQEQAMAAGAEVEMLSAERLLRDGDLWRISAGTRDFTALAVIAATGARLRKLCVPGEDEFAGRGVSQCASCDAPLLRGKHAVVVGGGDSAVQEALTLAPVLAKVTLVTRGLDLRAQPALADALRACGNVEILTGKTVSAITGSDGVTGAMLASASGEAAGEIACDAVFPFTGLEPDTQWLGDCVSRDATGAIETNGQLAAKSPGLYAAGAARSGWAGRAAASAGDGAAAAVAAHAWLART